MEQRVEELEKRLYSAESTLKWVKDTESGKYCLHDGKRYKNLEKFHDKQCLGHECRDGTVLRLDSKDVCPKLENCLYGTYRGPNDCCERCSSALYFFSINRSSAKTYLQTSHSEIGPP